MLHRRPTVLLGRCVLVACAALLAVGLHSEQSYAERRAVPGGWTQLGEVHLDKNGCAECPATFPTPNRWRTFGLASDSPFPVNLGGQVEIACADGSSYQVFVRPSLRGGLFEMVANTCVNFDSKEIRLVLTTVGLSPPDADRIVTLSVHGKLR